MSQEVCNKKVRWANRGLKTSFQTIFHNFSNIPSMTLVNASFKSHDLACYKTDMPLRGKWNVSVPYNSKAAGNLRKIAENVDSSNFSWIL